MNGVLRAKFCILYDTVYCIQEIVWVLHLFSFVFNLYNAGRAFFYWGMGVDYTIFVRYCANVRLEFKFQHYDAETLQVNIE